MFKPLMLKAVSPPHVGSIAESSSRSFADRELVQIEKKPSPIIGVIGAKGGVGGTTTAINLAAALSKTFGSAILLDTNLQQPDAAIMLGQHPKYDLLDLLERVHDADEKILAACSMAYTETNCRLITPSLDGQGNVRTHLSEVAQCLDFLRGHSDAWVLDLPKHLDKHLVTLMDRCTHLVLVFEPTIAALSGARRWVNLFHELGYPAERFSCVINRSGGKLKLIEQQLETLAPFTSMFRIPNAFELSEKCITHGQAAVESQPRAPYSVAVRELAKHIIDRV